MGIILLWLILCFVTDHMNVTVITFTTLTLTDQLSHNFTFRTSNSCLTLDYVRFINYRIIIVIIIIIIIISSSSSSSIV